MRSIFRPSKVALAHVIPDALVIILSLHMSLLLRVSLDEVTPHLKTMYIYLPLVLFVRLFINWIFGVYEIMWRYITSHDALIVARSLATSSALIIAFSFFVFDKMGQLPRAVYIIDWLLVTLGLLGIRIYRRIRYESARHATAGRVGVRTIIYGAGVHGNTLASRFLQDSSAGVNLVGFIDDDSGKQSIRISGVPVIGNLENLQKILEMNKTEQLVIAIDGLAGEKIRHVLQVCFAIGVRVKMLGSLRTSPQTSSVELYRDISLSDLLNRPAHKMDLRSIQDMIQDKTVLVTGAGGSIGSEISRQVLSYNPKKLLVLDHSEFNLYNIDNELRVNCASTSKVVPLLVDIKDEYALSRSMSEHKPDIVFHAAAYKHVHLVESNPFPSVINNIYGTYLLLKFSKEVGVQAFIQISTDKAVNPVGVMGSTKRVCELLVTAFALETGKRYCSVRFGNVLGSSGSLIPLLQKQILDGGPVTITHPNMTRYFMLIPEAVALVLKAATIARPGDINVLKMGDPVKIVDIAKSLIALMGARENEIPIVFTGLRPGEKIFEELYIRGDEIKTEHPDILTLPNGDSHLPSNMREIKTLFLLIERMLDKAREGSPESLLTLQALAKNSSIGLQDSESSITETVFSQRH